MTKAKELQVMPHYEHRVVDPPPLLLKFTRPEGKPSFAWGAPPWKVGQWRFVRGFLNPCSRGLHFTTPEQAQSWLAEELYVAEVRGKVVQSPSKYVAARARLVRRVEGWNPQNIAKFLKPYVDRVDNPAIRKCLRREVALIRKGGDYWQGNVNYVLSELDRIHPEGWTFDTFPEWLEEQAQA